MSSRQVVTAQLWTALMSAIFVGLVYFRSIMFEIFQDGTPHFNPQRRLSQAPSTASTVVFGTD